MAILSDFMRHLGSFESSPFLFVGAGCSRRYIKGPSWEGLLRHYAEKCQKTYEFYRASANDDLLKTGSLIAEDFHNLWWTSPEYQRSRERNKEICLTRQSALKIAISEGLSLAEHKLVLDPPFDLEIELLKQANIDGVITTNWDGLLERIFPDFAKFIGQDEIIFCNTQAIGEIYKIHGCTSKPNSIVLTAEDYKRFSDRNVYLAAKLLTIFVEHPVVFLGYGMRDPNVIDIIRSVVQVLDGKQLEKLRDRLIFIEWNEDPREENMQRAEFVVDSVSIPVIKLVVPNYLDIFRALSLTQRKLPIRLLRQLKQSVYELVKTTDPRAKLKVIGLDQTVDPKDIEFVVGVGITDMMQITGLNGITRDDIIRDLVSNDGRWTPIDMVFQGLPNLLKRAENTPFVKYLVQSGELGIDGKVRNPEKLDERVQLRLVSMFKKIIPSKGQYFKVGCRLANPALTPRQYYETHGRDNFLYCYALNEGAVPEIADELIAVLGEIRLELEEAHDLIWTAFYKLFCFADILKFCPALRPLPSLQVS